MLHTNPARHFPRRALIAAGVLLTLAPGCQYSDQLTDGPTYPALDQARVLDIHVRRDETIITFTNTSPEAIPACRMWVNRWWCREVDAIDIGETVRLDLTEFLDPYGEPFRAGGFFATEPPDRLLQAQFEYSGQIVGVVVIGD
ncbi:MAG: hypothetical protein AB7K52_05770 [Phycisphaerales bacterium]